MLFSLMKVSKKMIKRLHLGHFLLGHNISILFFNIFLLIHAFNNSHIIIYQLLIVINRILRLDIIMPDFLLFKKSFNLL